MSGPFTFFGGGGGGGSGEGPPGPPGEDGREIELAVISDSNSVDGNNLAWRYVGDPAWTILIDLDDLRGADGIGVPAGGTTGQVLAKASDTDYDTEWVDQTGGGSADYPEVMKRISLGF